MFLDDLRDVGVFWEEQKTTSFDVFVKSREMFLQKMIDVLRDIEFCFRKSVDSMSRWF